MTPIGNVGGTHPGPERINQSRRIEIRPTRDAP